MNEEKNVQATTEEQAPEATPDELTTKIQEFGGDDTVVAKLHELGVETIDDLQEVEEKDLEDAGMKRLSARKLLKSLQSTAPTESQNAPAINAANPTIIVNNVLPEVAIDESWLNSLRAGGVLKIEESTVIAAVSAALAKKAGLYDVPEKLVDLLEETANQIDEPVDPAVFAIRKQITRRNYADIFDAIPGMDGSFITEKRKKDLFSRMDQHFWPALVASYRALCGWNRNWRDSVSDPMIYLGAIGGISGIPPVAAPDTAVLCDASSSLKDELNKVFRGYGVQIVAGLAFEAKGIVDTLSNPALPVLTGSVNREQMLQKLGTAVSANYPRLERDLIRYVVSFIEFEEKAGAGTEATQYASQLYQLGNTIDWSKVGVRVDDDGGITGVTGHRVL